jgi:Domain of unknown function (DUF2431)
MRNHLPWTNENKKQQNAGSLRPTRLNILTVGDGDFSASLAILRAYYHGSSSSSNNDGSITVVEQLVATTLLSCKEDVIRTYPSSKAILDELESDYYGNVVTILYQVDATMLDTHPELTCIFRKHHKCDVILFHYPHLGYGNPDDDTEPSQEQQRALRHSALLAHYFDSAKQLLSEKGCIHVCLCSGAIQSWRLQEIVQHLQLQYCMGSPLAASRPLLEPFLQNDDAIIGLKQLDPFQKQQQQVSHNKTKVVGGSRRGHWLGRYGYRHQPTFPEVTEFQTNVSSSYHFFLQPTAVATASTTTTTSSSSSNRRNGMMHGDVPTSPGHYVCGICRQEFLDPAALQAHQEAPVLPTRRLN